MEPSSHSSQENPASGETSPTLAEPVISKMHWPFPLIWLIPIAAALVAGCYLYERHKDRGREITIEFVDGTGVKPNETNVEMLGVQVGQVVSMSVTPDHRHVDIHVRLMGDDRSIGLSGARFWIVKPDISEGGLSGLGTIISGPYIESLPGDGSEESKFIGMDKPPVMIGKGLRVVLHADRLEKLQVGSPVQYRGIQVGVVQDIRLSADTSQVNVTAFIWEHFAPLVRTNSVFWIVSGADVKGGVFTGVQVKLGSLQSIISGVVAFASPDDDFRGAAEDGTQFHLNSEPKSEWLKWATRIELSKEKPGPASHASESRIEKEAMGAEKQ